jgi:hypothetical protein
VPGFSTFNVFPANCCAGRGEGRAAVKAVKPVRVVASRRERSCWMFDAMMVVFGVVMFVAMLGYAALCDKI